MARVTGIGGIFLKARDPKASLLVRPTPRHPDQRVWRSHPPLDRRGPSTTGMTTWSLFPSDTTYFGTGNHEGPQQAMVNYRVDDLDALLTQLSTAGVTIDPKREDSDYGRFAWITDPEGNRIELWQPLP